MAEDAPNFTALAPDAVTVVLRLLRFVGGNHQPANPERQQDTWTD